jgi:hypothetical protein
VIFLFRKKKFSRQFCCFFKRGKFILRAEEFPLLFLFFGRRKKEITTFKRPTSTLDFHARTLWTTDEHTENGPSLSIQTRKDIKYLLLLGRVSKYNLARPNEETNLPRDYSRMRRRSRDISLCFLACFLLSLFPLYRRLSIGDDDYTRK